MDLLSPEEKIEKTNRADISLVKLKSDLFISLSRSLSEQSIEQSKHSILKGEMDPGSLARLKALNKGILATLRHTLASLQSMTLKEFSLEKLEMSEERKAIKIIEGMKDALPAIAANDPEIRKLLSEGILGLRRIEEKLAQVYRLNSEDAKRLALFASEIRELEKNIAEQDRLVDRIMFSRSLIGRLMRIRQETEELRGLIAREISEHNSLLKGAAEFRLQDELGEMSQIEMFDRKEMQISQDLKLMMNQFILPHIKLCSSFIAYKCPASEAVQIASLKQFIHDLPTNAEELRVNGRPLKAVFLEFEMDSMTTISKGDCAIVIPFESIPRVPIRIDGSKIRIYRLLQQLGKEHEVTEQMFDELIHSIDDRMKAWMEETKKLDEKFSKEWSEDAVPIIKKEFTKRWFNDLAGEYALKHGLDILPILVSMKMHEAHGKGLKFQKETFAEQIRTMTKEEFCKLIEQAKGFCKEALADAKRFGEPTLTDMLVVVPRRYVLYFEKYFNGRRPQILYYDGTLESAVASLVPKKRQKLPKAKTLRVFDKDLVPLEIIC